MAEGAKTLLTQNIPTSLTAVLTSGTTWSAKAQVVGIRAVNKTGTARWFSLQVSRGGTNVYPNYQQVVDPGVPYLETTMLVLESGDVLSVQAETANALDLTISGFEGVS